MHRNTFLNNRSLFFCHGREQYRIGDRAILSLQITRPYLEYKWIFPNSSHPRNTRFGALCFLNGFMGFISVAKIVEENFCARHSQQRQSKCMHLHKQELGTGRSLFDDKTQNLPFFPFLLTCMTLPTLLIVVVGT